MLEMKPSMMIYRKKKIWVKQIKHTPLMNVLVILGRANFENKKNRRKIDRQIESTIIVNGVYDFDYRNVFMI